MKDISRYDKTEEYENEVMELAFQLRKVCNRLKIPMFLSICVKNDNKESVYKNEMVSAVSEGIQLQDDKLVKFVNVLNGFETVPKSEDDMYDF